jgi:GTP cyclohydrolase IA
MTGWIGVDFDGTLAHYDGATTMNAPGEPIAPMVARVKAWLAEGVEVRVFTARVGGDRPPEDIAHQRRIVQHWCDQHIGQVLPVTAEKDFAMLELWDDRAVQVETNVGGWTPAFAVQRLLQSLGEDPDREGLENTPARVARFYEEFKQQDFVMTTFDAEGMSEMVVQRNIPFYSLCEHHMLPFFGSAVVAYVPDGKIVGLSKLTRAVQASAAGLNNQERITSRVANVLMEVLKPHGCAVRMVARHMCMEMRGVQAPGVESMTTVLRGSMFDDANQRAEFLRVADGG